MDGEFASMVNRAKVLVDIVDEQWLADALSDDDIDIPPEFVDHSDDETPDGEEHRRTDDKHEKWQELGLAPFLATEKPPSANAK